MLISWPIKEIWFTLLFVNGINLCMQKRRQNSLQEILHVCVSCEGQLARYALRLTCASNIETSFIWLPEGYLSGPAIKLFLKVMQSECCTNRGLRLIILFLNSKGEFSKASFYSKGLWWRQIATCILVFKTYMKLLKISV